MYCEIFIHAALHLYDSFELVSLPYWVAFPTVQNIQMINEFKCSTLDLILHFYNVPL